MKDSGGSEKTAVVLVPHAGGDHLAYTKLIKGLSYKRDVLFYELPGHGIRAGESFAKSYQEILCELIEFIQDKTSGYQDYIMCGVSMGAYLCDNAYGKLLSENCRLPRHVIYAAVDPSKTSEMLSKEDIMQKSADAEILSSHNAYSIYLKDILEKDLDIFFDGRAIFGTTLKCPLSYFMGKDDRLLGKVDYDWSILAPEGYREYLFEGQHLFMTSNANVITTINRICDHI